MADRGAIFSSVEAVFDVTVSKRQTKKETLAPKPRDIQNGAFLVAAGVVLRPKICKFDVGIGGA